MLNTRKYWPLTVDYARPTQDVTSERWTGGGVKLDRAAQSGLEVDRPPGGVWRGVAKRPASWSLRLVTVLGGSGFKRFNVKVACAIGSVEQRQAERPPSKKTAPVK